MITTNEIIVLTRLIRSAKSQNGKPLLWPYPGRSIDQQAEQLAMYLLSNGVAAPCNAGGAL